MKLQKIQSDTNILTRKNLIYQRKISSVRINSACIRKNSTKYTLYSHEKSKFTSEKEISDLYQNSPILKFNPQAPNPISYMHQVEKRVGSQLQKQLRQLMLIIIRFQERKNNQKSLTQKKRISKTSVRQRKSFSINISRVCENIFQRAKFMIDCFSNITISKKKNILFQNRLGIIFIKNPMKLINIRTKLINKVLKKIIMEEEQKKKRETKQKIISRKNLEIKEEDRQERQYKKELLEKFVSGEQMYFDKLTNIANRSGKLFENKLVLKDTYHFDNILYPENQFVSYKDLNYQREQLIEFESKQQSCMDSKIMVQNLVKDELLEDEEVQINDEEQKQIRITDEFEQQILIPSRKQSQIQSPVQCQKQLQPDISDINEEEIKNFWLHVRTNQKQKVKFAVLIEPRLLQLEDINGMTPLHWSIMRDYTSLSKYEIGLLIFSYFILKRLNLYQADKKGRTPRDIAFERNNVKLKQLIRHLELANFYTNKENLQEQMMITESDDEQIQ